MSGVRCFGAVASVVVVTALPARAHAYPKPWIEARAGVGVVTGQFEFEKSYDDANGQSQVAHDEDRAVGIAIALGVEGGHVFSQELALGLFARLEVAPYLVEVKPRYSTVNGHALAAFGPALLYRPTLSVEVRLAPEWAFARFIGSRTDIGAYDNVFEFESVNGPGASLSAGTRWQAGWGVAASANVAVLSGAHTHFTPMSLTVLAGWSSW